MIVRHMKLKTLNTIPIDMQKQNTLKCIAELLLRGDVYMAVSHWFHSYHPISVDEFLEAAEKGEWTADELVEVLAAHRDDSNKALLMILNNNKSQTNGKS